MKNMTIYLQTGAVLSSTDHLVQIVNNLVSVLLMLIASYSAVKVLFSVFVGQINLVSGRSGAIAELISEMIPSLILIAMASQVHQLSGTFMGIFYGQEFNTSAAIRQALDLIVIQPLFSLTFALAVAATIVGLVLLAFKAQISILFTSSSGIEDSWSAITAMIFLFMFGILGLRAITAIFST